MTEKQIYCYLSGPIEKDPTGSFQAKNNFKDSLQKLGIEIAGNSFEFLKSKNCSQEIYGQKLKQLRNLGKFYEYNQQEILLVMSLRAVRRSDFMIVRPSAEASGGTTSELTTAWRSGIPKLIIIGAHGENLTNNDSTFVTRIITDKFSLVFNTEKEILNFIKDNMLVFKQGRRAIRELILKIKRCNPYFNDQLKLLYNKQFDGKIIVILGMPGSGKGTQSRLLQNKCGFKYFGSGHELRLLANKFPPLAESLAKGKLAPEIIINQLLSENILKLEKFESIVIDGSPKKLREAEALMELLNLLERKIQIIILDINVVTARERLILRRNCDNCETSFCTEELAKNPTCPQCNATLTIRPENSSEEAIDEIFDWYLTDVNSVINFFKKSVKVSHVDGEQNKEKIFQDILKII